MDSYFPGPDTILPEEDSRSVLALWIWCMGMNLILRTVFSF